MRVGESEFCTLFRHKMFAVTVNALEDVEPVLCFRRKGDGLHFFRKPHTAADGKRFQYYKSF